MSFVFDRKFLCKCVYRNKFDHGEEKKCWFQAIITEQLSVVEANCVVVCMCMRTVKLNYEMLIKKVARSQNNYTSIARSLVRTKRKFDRLCWCKKKLQKIPFWCVLLIQWWNFCANCTKKKTIRGLIKSDESEALTFLFRNTKIKNMIQLSASLAQHNKIMYYIVMWLEMDFSPLHQIKVAIYIVSNDFPITFIVNNKIQMKQQTKKIGWQNSFGQWVNRQQREKKKRTTALFETSTRENDEMIDG